ncbi:hypothetical protein KKE03_03550 [Patescibacteria group bacterium]|nr:hypothetical protein [Patescibacteria group bacterium]
MVKLSGFFDSFDNLDQISSEAIAAWLKPAPQLSKLENYLANRILYPKAQPLTETDMQIDLAILREVLKMGNPFLNITLRKILIPAKFLEYAPDLKSLTWAFIDALVQKRNRQDFYQDIWTIVLTADSDEIVGSVILSQFDSSSGEMELSVLDKKYKILPGSLTVIPCPKERCKIAYSLRKGKLLGKQSSTLEIYGGKLGLMIDGRHP